MEPPWMTMNECPVPRFFRDALLRVMGRLCNLTPEQDIPYNDILTDAVLAEFGLSVHQFGANEYGEPRTKNAIRRAFMSMEGKLTQKGSKKGQWALTEEGVRVVRSSIPQTVAVAPTSTPDAAENLPPSQTLSVDGGDAQTPILSVQAAANPYPGGDGVSLSFGSIESSYSDDLYICGLSIAAVSGSNGGFGYFSPHPRSVCMTACGLADRCRASVVIRIPRIAANLVANETEVKQREMPQTAKTRLVVADQGVEEALADLNAHPRPITIEAAATSICMKCSGQIPQKERCHYVKGKGMYHLRCHPT